jgi:putative acetyltransferase
MRTWMVSLDDDRRIVLRLLTANDRDLLLELVSAFSEETLRWGNPPYDEGKIERWMSGAGKGLSLVAIYNEKIVGIAASYTSSLPRARGIGGMMIYLHQDFHGVGLGTAMTEKFLVLAKEKELHRIGLEVVEDNIPAVRLYNKCGFRIEGTLIDAYYGADGRFHNMLVMGKVL